MENNLQALHGLRYVHLSLSFNNSECDGFGVACNTLGILSVDLVTVMFTACMYGLNSIAGLSENAPRK